MSSALSYPSEVSHTEDMTCNRFFVIDGFLDVTITSTAQADVDFRMESAPKGDQELLFEIKVSQITDP